MSYTINEEKVFPHSKETLMKAVMGAIDALEGKVIKNDQLTGRLVAKFHKTILGNVLGDRTQLELEILTSAPHETTLSMVIFPINPVGQPLQFGARKGVPRKVLTWFVAHVEHRLKKRVNPGFSFN